MKKFFSGLVILSMLLAFLPADVFAAEDSLAGTTVVLFTGNIRGDVSLIPLIAAVRADFEARGADVLLVDTGNFLQGTRYTSFNSGSTMITLMMAAGYNAVALGTYDFAFGTGAIGAARMAEVHGDVLDFGPLGDLLEANGLTAVASNISGANDYFHSFFASSTIVTESGISFGIVGLTDPYSAGLLLESNLVGIEFTDPAAVDLELDTDVVLVLSNASMPEMEGAIVIDTAPTPIPSSFTIGSVLIDNDTLEYDWLNVELSYYTADAELAAVVDEFMEEVAEAFPRVYRSLITLDGSIERNRGGETNLGNFWADALRWFAVSGEINAYFDEDDVDAGLDSIQVSDEYVVALWNAGNLRDFLYPGDVTVQDLRRVLPFPNTVAVVYLTGAELLEQLEASAQGLPYTDATHALTASFMHVSGLEYVVNTDAAFNAGESYRERAWYTAASVERVSITSVNGRPFDENALYAVITSNANFNGMDISYVLAARESDTEGWSTITTARVVDQAVMGFIASLPRSEISWEQDALPGRVVVGDDVPFAMQFPVPVPVEIEVFPVYETLEVREDVTRGAFLGQLYATAGSPDVAVTDRFADVPAGHTYAAAIAWAYETGLVVGVSRTRFAPDALITAEQIDIIMSRFGGNLE